MAINIQNIIAALEAKVAAATSATETQELIVIIKSIKAAGQQTVVTYADVPNLPTASADNAGNLAYVAAVGKIYYSNGTTWTEVGSGSGGGGGTAYDQSLNTTDDVVFNSALVGDVSIIGNKIAATDSYGNVNTLELDAPVDFKSIVSQSFSANLNFGQAYLTYGSNQIELIGLGPYQSEVTQLLALPLMSLVTVSGLYDYNTYQYISLRFIVSNPPSTTDDMYNPGSYSAVTYSNPSSVEFSTDGINWSFLDTSSTTYTLYPNQSSVVVAFASSTTVETNIASVTENGLNVEGALTVTGGGDVVLDSALIGDVSIIGNEISATDAYGNDAALVLNTPVDFNFTGTTTTAVQTQISMSGVSFQTSMIGAFQIYDLYGSFQSEANQIVNLPQGTVITTGDIFSFATYQNTRFRFTINSVQSSPDMYNPSVISSIFMYPIAQQFEYSTDGGQTWTTTSIFSYNLNRNNINLNLSFEAQVTTNVAQTAVSVTETGLNVNGALTVNGQPIAGGSGSSYDQSLNTTDDVVFNSALVGDVSIIGNEISGVDIYGNAGALVLNVPVEFKATETTNSETIIDFGASSFIVPTFNFGTYEQYVSLRNNSSGIDPSAAQQLMAIPSGTLVTTNVFSRFNFMTYQTENKYFRFVVNGTPTSFNNNPYNPSAISEIRYTVVSGTLESSTDGVNWTTQAYDNNNYQPTSTAIITYGGTTTVESTLVSVTATGVNVNGDLSVTGTLNGYQPVGLTQLTLDSTNVQSMIFPSAVRSTLYISRDPSYNGTDAVSIVLPTGLEGQRITIFNSSTTNTCTIMNAYPLAGSPPAPAAMAPQSTLTVIHLTGGNWVVC